MFSMKVLAVGGDPGGSRALLPVLEKLYKVIPFVIVDHGFLTKEVPIKWPRISVHLPEEENSLEKLFEKGEFGVLLFSTSTKDTLALQIARLAKQFNVPSICLLDNWMNYRMRLEIDGLPTFWPDIYAVLDDRAYEGAVADGIPKSILRITGQPALSSLAEDLNKWSHEKSAVKLKSLMLPQNKKLLIFISEPVEYDQGSHEKLDSYRGYTEKTVLRDLCHLLQPFSDLIYLGIVHHPRENVEDLDILWQQNCGNLNGGILRVESGREAVFLADGISGMASILLYEGWVIGKPVLSLQSGLRRSDLRFMEKRENCFCVTDSNNMEGIVKRWIEKVEKESTAFRIRCDLERHIKAPDTICRLIRNFITEMDDNPSSQ